MTIARLSIKGLMKSTGYNRKEVKSRIKKAGIKPTSVGYGSRLYDYSILNMIMNTQVEGDS